MKREKFILASLILVVLAFGFLFSGCPAPRPPAEKYVIFLSLADYTGPIAGLNVPFDMATEDSIKDINERGGVDGVKIRFIGVDTRYDVARAVSAYKRYRLEPKLIVVNSISTAGAKALVPFYERDRIVALTPAAGEFQAKPGRIFLWGPCYQDYLAASFDWMVEDWKAKGKPGLPVVGYINWDNPYGREHLMGGKEYAEKIGITLLKPEFFPPGTLKHDVYLTRMAGAGANYIYVGGVDPTPTNIIRDAHALGLTKTIQFVTEPYGPSETVGIKAHPEAVEGTVMVSAGLRGEELMEHPLNVLWTKYRQRPLEEMPETYLTGAGIGLGLEEVLKRALREVSYEELDGEVVYQYYKTLGGWDYQPDIGFGPNAYSETSRRGSEYVAFYKIVNSKWVRITEGRKIPDAVALYKW